MVYGLVPAQFLPAPPELIVILVIIVILFGADKIPKLARSGGEALGEFKKGKQELEKELEEEKEQANDSDSESDDDDLESSETTEQSETEK